jgi:secondary thiamine-phosphate synthase enzyme
MKSYTEYLWFCTKERQQFLNITSEVAQIVRKSGISEGFVLVSAMHITAGVYVNDAEEGLIHDIQRWCERLAPWDNPYEHNITGEDNGAAHLRNLLIGHQVVLPVTGGKLDLGPWEQVYYAEFDGLRRKRVIVKVIGE